jgi:hypothetical protein
MAIATKNGTAQTPLDMVWVEIQEHGIEKYIADLDVNGFTILPPEIACPNGLHERLLEAVLDVGEKRNGVRPDVETGSTHKELKGRFAAFSGKDGDSPIGDLMQSLLFEGEVFEEALINPVLLTVASYLLGYSCVLSSMGCFMKGPNKSSFTLHTDTPLPSPLPPHSLVCNCTYVLTDFTEENGATAFVPGSHKLCRGPEGREMVVGEGGNDKVVPAECPAGSLICWHGNTWHGAYNRTASGLRVSLPVYMARPNIRTQEGLIGKIPQEMLDRNDPRFAILTQQGISYGYESHTDSVERATKAGAYMKAFMENQDGPLQGSRGLFS